MSVRFRSIMLPLQIIKQEQFARGIQQSNLNVFNGIEYLKKFIQSNHEICHNGAKQINKLVLSTHKKFSSPCREQYSFSEFLNSLQEINQCMESQINKNFIFINSRKSDNIKRVKQVINDKLEKAGESVKEFINMARQYNNLGETYIKKSEYFDGIEKNPVKYYAFSKNQRKFEKIRNIQQELESRLDSLSSLKSKIKVMMIELSIKISEFYESIRIKIEDLRKMFQIVLHKVIELIKTGNKFSKIQQASQGAEQSQMIDKTEKQNDNSKILSLQKNLDVNRESSTLKQYIKSLKKQESIKNEVRNDFENVLLNFITNFLYEINLIITNLHTLETHKDYKHFQDEKKLINELLPPRCLQDMDAIIEESKVIKNIFTGIEKIIAKDVIEEILKRQKLYFNRFIQEIDHYSDKSGEKDQEKLLKEVSEKVRRYKQDENEWIHELDHKFKQMINRLKSQFVKKTENRKITLRADKRSDLFGQPYFQILKVPYFEHNKHLDPFIRSEYMIKYEEIIKSDRIKKIIFDLQTDPKLENTNKEIKKKSKSSCCGLFRKTDKKNVEGKNFLQQLKKSKQIDSYNCALKDGFMLYQGSITIYAEYLRFHSSFNPSTFFGSTDIFIPKFDIYEVIKGKHIMSLLVTVITKRGNIEFTSFFSDPFDTLVEVYMSNRNTEYDNATCHLLDKQDKAQLEELKEKMQKQFVELASKNRFRIVKVTPKYYENCFQLEYTYFDEFFVEKEDVQKGRIQMFFRVNIKYYQNSLEYLFWHSDTQSLDRKTKLQQITKLIIYKDRQQQMGTKDTKPEANFDDNISFHIGEQVSIIGEKQKHNFDLEGMDRSTVFFNAPRDMQRKNTSFFENSPNMNSVSLKNKSLSGIFSSRNVLGDWLMKNSMMKKQGNTDNILNSLEQQTQKVVQKKTTSRFAEPMTAQINNSFQKVNATNSFHKKLIESQVSQNASTVKFGERSSRIGASMKKVRKSEVQKQSNEGMQNAMYLIGVAFLLILILRIFS